MAPRRSRRFPNGAESIRADPLKAIARFGQRLFHTGLDRGQALSDAVVKIARQVLPLCLLNGQESRRELSQIQLRLNE